MHELLTSPAEIGAIVLRTLVVYAFVLAGFRLSGKREVGQLAPFDFALILLVANAVQNAMVGGDTSLVGGLAAAAVLLALNRLLGTVAARHRKVQRLLSGTPRMLVYHGRLDAQALRDEHVAHDDLMQALREGGCAGLNDCRLAVLEVDGKISVIGNAGKP